jgi:hypothetical protein
MGNSAGKEQRLPNGQPQPRSHQLYNSRHPSNLSASSDSSVHASSSNNDRYLANHGGTRSRHRGESNLFGSGQDRNSDAPEPRRETKVERDARRADRERQARLKEREWSMREESVDGGYLVTLGTYTGAEDFNKPIVRQLIVSGSCHFDLVDFTCLTSRSTKTD